MAGNLIIVAIPDENDRVWKVSSEKVPHLTLLFLGEDADQVPNLDQIMLFVEHAANTTLRRFYLPVDRRGELGEGKADVLYFRKDRYDFKAIRDFRAVLLQDTNIKKAYDATSQFEAPEYVGASGQPWIPHLTLGYPESPAKPVPDDQLDRFYSVEFIKIAVWSGDYEGPEFLLKDYWEDFDMGDIPMNVAMSEISHHGVKGMRWGVRKEDFENAASSSKSPAAKKLLEASRFLDDVDFETKTRTTKDEYGTELDSEAKNAVIDAASTDFHKKDLPAIKNKPEYQKARKLRNRLLRPTDPATRAYRKEVKQAYINRLETTANSMKNVSGTRQYTIRERGGELPGSQYYWEVRTREVQHAGKDDFTLVEVLMDEDGFITGTKRVEKTEAIAQTMDLGVEFLAHYGVKGMRWGVRNDKGGSNTSSVGEKKKGMWDPEGQDLATDIFKAVVWPLVPPLGLFAIPAEVRLARGAARGVKAKAIDVNEKRFANHAQSHKNFVKIHNAAGAKINSELPKINDRHPGDLTKDPKKQKAYDDDVQKTMQNAYREAAQSIGNRPNTMHLDLEFRNDGFDFAIKAKQGAAKPLPQRVEVQRVKHAAEDEETVELEYSGKILRDATGHIRGFEFDTSGNSLTQTVDLGEAFLAHYGVKGMRWGVRKEREPVAPVAVSLRRGEAGYRTSGLAPRVAPRAKTRIHTQGGENQPAHEDALKVARAQAKLKKSGTAALSNQELQELQTRLNLERNVTTLVKTTGRVGRGRQFVRDLTGMNREANEAVSTVQRSRDILRPRTA